MYVHYKYLYVYIFDLYINYIYYVRIYYSIIRTFMKKTKKSRLNLYLSDDIIMFAKKWSYVTQTPISKMLEEHLWRQKEIVSSISPFQWLNDPHINPELKKEDDYYGDLVVYLNNREEEDFCDENPEHPRAKMRRALKKEFELYLIETVEKKKKSEKHFIQRWMETFQIS